MDDPTVRNQIESEDERVAVITGAAGGIGTGIARHLSERGLQVVLIDLDGDALDGAASGCTGSVLSVVADVTDSTSMDRAARVHAEFGGAHVLVVNAGVGPAGDLQGTTGDDWERAVSVNLTGAFNTLKAFGSVLRGTSGHRSVVMTSSVLALRGARNMLAYSAAKSGLLGIVQSAAQDLAADGITVNALAPGPIRTPLLDAIAGDTLADLQATVPLRRLGSPDDIAHAVHFLTSPEASFITGQVVAVDGGLSGRAFWRDAAAPAPVAGP